MRQLFLWASWLWSLNATAQSITAHRQINTVYESHPYQDEKAIEKIVTASVLRPGTQVAYRAGQSIILTYGFVAQAGSVFMATITPVSTESELGMRLAVQPNPVGLNTWIDYRIPDEGEVTLSITDAKGSTIQQLVKELKGSGAYHHNWDSSQLTAGVYICVLRVGNQALSVRIVKQ